MLIVGMTACGKTHYLLKMLEEDFKGYFDCVFILCPTFAENKTYQSWKYLKDPDVFAMPCDHDEVDNYLETIVKFAKGTNNLIILDDCASTRVMKNRTSKLVKLAFHGRHIGLSTIVNHAATYLYRETLQNERVEGRSLLQCSKGRPQRHLRKLPLRGKGREKNLRDVKEREVRPVRNSDGSPVHAQSRDTLNFHNPFRVMKFFLLKGTIINGTGTLLRGILKRGSRGPGAPRYLHRNSTAKTSAASSAN